MRYLYCFVILIIFCKSINCELIRHTFVIEYFSGSPDGVYKEKILGINGQFPGPLIEGQIGDTLQVDVINRIQDRQNTSIHWHGIFQKETPWEDGAPYITQCPITFMQTQRYSFQLKQTGTFWYHSHYHAQYTEGLWGVLIVHNKPEEYSYDGHIIIALSDWYHRTAIENEQYQLSTKSEGIFPYIDSGLINGVGRYHCGFAKSSCNISHQIRPVFKVQREKTYRIHVLNTAALVAYNFSIDGHRLQAIEVDSVDLKNGLFYDVATIASGQRYSFLITTNEMTTTRFLIRATIRKEFLMPHIVYVRNNNMYSEMVIGDVTAILEYSEEDSLGSEPHSYLDEIPKEVKEAKEVKELVPLDEMELLPFDGVYAPRKYDVDVVLTVEFLAYKDGLRRGSFNHTPYLHTYSAKPLLMSVMDGEKINDDIFHMEVDRLFVVNVIINNPGTGPHPFHLHGHNFWVLGKGNWNDGNYEDIKHNRTLTLNGPKRDTVLVEERSWAVIRFIADNPGVWMFHCHVEWHLLTGMSFLFVVGRKEIENFKVDEEVYNVCKNSNKFVNEKSSDNNNENSSSFETTAQTYLQCKRHMRSSINLQCRRHMRSSLNAKEFNSSTDSVSGKIGKIPISCNSVDCVRISAIVVFLLLLLVFFKFK